MHHWKLLTERTTALWAVYGYFFIFKEAFSVFRHNVLDAIGGHHLEICQDGFDNKRSNYLSFDLHKVFFSWLQFETPLFDDRELFWLPDEHLEGVVVLVESAKGHFVAVEVQDQPKSIFLPTLRHHFLSSSAALHALNQSLVF